ncbi:MAG TPA: MFS transporter [Acidimicrobiales bacterium]|nr:MFS transporter [Acidimicrobiales bacterium]
MAPATSGERSASLGLILALLLPAAFFDGYDAQIMALLLPQIQDSFHASVTALGLAHIPIALGQFVAFFIIRQADRVGRRPLLLLTVFGYTAFTAATAAAWDLWSFAALQFGAQVFIGAEFAVAVTMLVELFPNERRGRALGALLTFGPLGAVVVAVLLDAGLEDTALGWRVFYLVGILPLVVVALARRRLPETPRFEAERRVRAQGTAPPAASFLEPWLPRYRKRLVLVGLVSLFQTLPSSAAVAWWAFYAERERGLSTGQVATYVIFAYGAGLFGYYSCGRLMDRVGRRPTAVIYILCTVVAGMGLFQSGGSPASPVLLAVAVFFGLGIGPVMSAFATELFPTRIRAQASSWVRNWFAIIGSALGPSLVGVLGDPYRGTIGNIGNTVTLLMLVALPSAFFILRFMPETRGVDLGSGAGSAGRLPQRADVLGAPEIPDAKLRRSFGLGLVAVVVLLGAISGAVLAFGTGQERPSGAGQEWLFDMAGSTASSGRQASLSQAEKLGNPSLARSLIVPGTEDKGAFTRIIVGSAAVSGKVATVPFTVVRPTHSGAPSAISGVLALVRSLTGWRVVGVGGVHSVQSLPSPATPALPGPLFAWAIGALVVVAVLTAAASLVISRAGRAERAPPDLLPVVKST